MEAIPKMNQKQWLNVVIMLISALILIFVLIGRFMNKSVEEYDNQTIQNEIKPPMEEPKKNG